MNAEYKIDGRVGLHRCANRRFLVTLNTDLSYYVALLAHGDVGYDPIANDMIHQGADAQLLNDLREMTINVILQSLDYHKVTRIRIEGWFVRVWFA